MRLDAETETLEALPESTAPDRRRWATRPPARRVWWRRWGSVVGEWEWFDESEEETDGE